jgi:hypothetical protein
MSRRRPRPASPRELCHLHTAARGINNESRIARCAWIKRKGQNRANVPRSSAGAASAAVAYCLCRGGPANLKARQHPAAGATSLLDGIMFASRVCLCCQPAYASVATGRETQRNAVNSLRRGKFTVQLAYHTKSIRRSITVTCSSSSVQVDARYESKVSAQNP